MIILKKIKKNHTLFIKSLILFLIIMLTRYKKFRRIMLTWYKKYIIMEKKSYKFCFFISALLLFCTSLDLISSLLYFSACLMLYAFSHQTHYPAGCFIGGSIHSMTICFSSVCLFFTLLMYYFFIFDHLELHLKLNICFKY